VYFLRNIIRVLKTRIIRWKGNVARVVDTRAAHRAFLGKPEGIRQLKTSRRRWEDNIKMDLQEMGYVVLEWIDLAQYMDSWRNL
jgi:hypothetical protein